MNTCDVCKLEVKPGEGVYAWNLVTGYQAFLHIACQPQFNATSAWCRMGMHASCPTMAYTAEGAQPCACGCHQDTGQDE